MIIGGRKRIQRIIPFILAVASCLWAANGASAEESIREALVTYPDGIMRADMKAEQDLYAIIPGVALLQCDTVQDPDSLYGGYSQFVGYLGTTSTEEVVKGPYYSYFCNETTVSENGRSVKSRLGYPGDIVVSGLWKVTDAPIEIGAKITFSGGPRGAMNLEQAVPENWKNCAVALFGCRYTNPMKTGRKILSFSPKPTV